MRQYCPKRYELSCVNIKVKLDLSNFITKSDLKKPTGVDTSKFAKKADLASLKLDSYELDIYNLKYVPFNLSNLSDIVKLYVMNWLWTLMLFRLLILMI